MARRLAAVPDYFLVPRWFWPSALQHRLKPREVMTFLVMCAMCDPDRLVTSSMREIAEEGGIARSNVAIALPELVERGFLVDLGAPATRRPRHYRISQAAPLPPASLHAQPTAHARMTGTGWLEVM